VFVYVITNHINGKLYIGKTVSRDLGYYLSRQFWCAKNQDKSHTSKPHLFNAMRKYPTDCWSIYPLISDVQTHEELLHWERVLIKALGTQKYGYNICAGGRGTIGWKPSTETRARQSASNKGKHRERLASPEMQAARITAWQESLEQHGGSFQTSESIEKIKQARAQQDETYRLAVWKRAEEDHGKEWTERRVATRRRNGSFGKMSESGRKVQISAVVAACHNRWHVGRGLTNPSCKSCK